MDYLEQLGPVALGSRLRRLTERLTADAARVHAELYGVELDARWYAVVRYLDEEGRCSVGRLAEALGQSHASICQIINGMQRAGMVTRKPDPRDRRVTTLSLSARGRKQAARLREQSACVEEVVGQMRDPDADLWAAIGRFEAQLDAGSLYERALRARTRQRIPDIHVIDYQTRHRRAFARLNYRWIEALFEVEEADRKALDDPDGYIIARGGRILLARSGRSIVGTGALLPMADGGFELAKMAVNPAQQGRGVGLLIGIECVLLARQLEAPRLYLETNSSLKPAIALYEKLGFRHVRGAASPYARADVQMELRLR